MPKRPGPSSPGVIDSWLFTRACRNILAEARKGVSQLRVAESKEPVAYYSSSKAAFARWMRRQAITADWVRAGILLNGIALGMVVTPMTQALVDDKAVRAQLETGDAEEDPFLTIAITNRKKTFPGPQRSPGHDRGTDRNRRASDYPQEDQRDRQTLRADPPDVRALQLLRSMRTSPAQT